MKIVCLAREDYHDNVTFMDNITRVFQLELQEGRSAFLWGPRQVGKSYWIHHQLANERPFKIIDLLQTDVYAQYASKPSLLRERWDGKFTIIDEIQKVPALLDEVHWLITHKNAQFLLTGSSARKLKRGHANLLGGRAWRFEMGPLCSYEIPDFDLDRALTHGLLPSFYVSDFPKRNLQAYVSDYLKEEIAAEAVTQNIPAFSEFLRVASLTNTELVNYTNVARETGVSAKVVRSYFQILEDTMLAERLKPWKKSPDRRMIQTEKFFMFDVGVANYLARRTPTPKSMDFGKSFEHFIWMEIRNFKRYCAFDLELHFWRTASGLEVDFIMGNMEVAIEVKASKNVHKNHLKGLVALHEHHPDAQRILVSLEKEKRALANGIQIWPWQDFLNALWHGEIIKKSLQ